MKRIISLLLAVLSAASAVMFAGCKKEPDYVPEGPTDVDYGEVGYKTYEDDSALGFDYLDCFVRSSVEEESFVANTEDDKGVLSYEFSATSLRCSMPPPLVRSTMSLNSSSVFSVPLYCMLY